MLGRVPTNEPGFLAPPDDVGDWRRVVLTDVAVGTGLLDALPDTPSGAARHLGLDPHAVRVLLEALGEWDVVEPDPQGRYGPGPSSPTREEAAVLHHHARVIRRWSESLGSRLRGQEETSPGQRSPEERERWLGALAAQARQRADEVAGRCLQRFPAARHVLDLAGGHGEYGLAFARRGCEVTLQDVPEVIDLVSRWPSVRAGPLRLFAGDVFQQLPEIRFDLVLCAGFTHTLPGERVAELLARLAAVTAPAGGVAIHTFLRGHRPVAPIFAVQMLLAGQGGDTHREEEYRRWLAGAGYDATETVDLGDRDLLLANRPPAAR